MSYHKKYLKYKNKYLELKYQTGGNLDCSFLIHNLSNAKLARDRKCPDNVIKKFDPKVLLDAGYTKEKISNLGLTGFTAQEIKNAGFTAKGLKEAGFTAKEIKDTGFTVLQLKEAGFTAKGLKEAGFTAKGLIENGLTAFTAKQLKEGGFTAKELKDAGFSAFQLKEAGFTLKELMTACKFDELTYTPYNTPQPLYTIKQLIDAGAKNDYFFVNNNYKFLIWQLNYEEKELKEIKDIFPNYTANVLAEYFPLRMLIKNFSIKELKNVEDNRKKKKYSLGDFIFAFKETLKEFNNSKVDVYYILAKAGFTRDDFNKERVDQHDKYNLNHAFARLQREEEQEKQKQKR